MFVVGLLIWLAVLSCWCIIRRRRVPGGKLPGPKGYPILGNISLFWGSPEEIFGKMFRLAEAYPKLVALWFGPVINVVVYDAEYLEVIFKSNRKMEKADEYKYFRPWLGTSLIISSGLTYKRHKKIIMSSFQTASIVHYVDIFYKNSKLLVESVESLDGEEEFDVCSFLNSCTLATILETSMGTKKETLGGEFRAYVDAVERLEKYVYVRTFSAWLRPSAIFKFSKIKKIQDKYLRILNRAAENVLAGRMKSQNEENPENRDDFGRRDTFLDVFLKRRRSDACNFTEEEIKDEIKGISFAGQDTTMVALGFALCLLGIYQDVQDKAMNELSAIFGDSARPPTYHDVQNMKYLEQVVFETLRLYPPVPLIAKKLTNSIKLDGFVIPENCNLIVYIMRLHRDPNQYRHPHRFDPDNFSPENVRSRNPWSFVPFSAGFRQCLGQKYAVTFMKVMLSTFLRRYKVYSRRKEEDFLLSVLTTLKIKNGCLISVRSRN